MRDAAQQLVRADHRPRRLNHCHQDIERATAECYRLAVGKQLSAMRKDTEVAELDDRWRVGLANDV